MFTATLLFRIFCFVSSSVSLSFAILSTAASFNCNYNFFNFIFNEDFIPSALSVIFLTWSVYVFQ
jgi:hypothetical protein